MQSMHIRVQIEIVILMYSTFVIKSSVMKSDIYVS